MTSPQRLPAPPPLIQNSTSSLPPLFHHYLLPLTSFLPTYPSLLFTSSSPPRFPTPSCYSSFFPYLYPLTSPMHVAPKSPLPQPFLIIMLLRMTETNDRPFTWYDPSLAAPRPATCNQADYIILHKQVFAKLGAI